MSDLDAYPLICGYPDCEAEPVGYWALGDAHLCVEHGRGCDLMSYSIYYVLNGQVIADVDCAR